MDDDMIIPQLKLSTSFETNTNNALIYGGIGSIIGVATYLLVNRIAMNVLKDMNAFIADTYVDHIKRIQDK